MFWKRSMGDHYDFIAVRKLVRRMANEQGGYQHYDVHLADGTIEPHVFSADEWRAWQAGLLQGGQVLNGA